MSETELKQKYPNGTWVRVTNQYRFPGIRGIVTQYNGDVSLYRVTDAEGTDHWFDEEDLERIFPLTDCPTAPSPDIAFGPKAHDGITVTATLDSSGTVGHPAKPKRKRGPTLASVVESNGNLKLGLERLRLRVKGERDQALECEAAKASWAVNITDGFRQITERIVRLNDQIEIDQKSQDRLDRWLHALETRQIRFERKVKIGASIILILATAVAFLAIGPHAALAWVINAIAR